MALTQRNHQLISDHFADKNTATMLAIDSTCGNGHDTLFLANLGFSKIYGFDIQQQAIDNTKQILHHAGFDNVTLINAGHETIDQYISTPVDCIMFNFGYLPTADKNITTMAPTSLAALQQALDLLSNNGLISLLCYPGHPQGALETKSIQQCLKTLDPSFKATEILASHPSVRAPILYLIQRINN